MEGKERLTCPFLAAGRFLLVVANDMVRKKPAWEGLKREER